LTATEERDLISKYEKGERGVSTRIILLK